MSRDCVFCRIVAGDEPASVIRRTESAIVIMPLEPVVPGHLLVIPTLHVRDFTVAPSVSATMMRLAAKAAADRGGAYNLITSKGPEATQTVFHLHLHLIPRRAGDELALPWTARDGPVLMAVPASSVRKPSLDTASLFADEEVGR